MNSLVVLTDVEHRLARIATLDDAKNLRDQAEAIRVYAKSAKKGLSIQNRAAAIKILAERRAGELLKGVERAQGKDGKGLRLTLSQSDIPEPTAKRWQAMAAVPEARVRALETELTALGQELTSAGIYAEARGKPHVAQNAGEPEWYTPPAMLAAAREVMGGIDLDPASHTDAQTQVHAARYFTRETDGLSKPWKGRVWLNPPYSHPAVARFCAKLVTAYQAQQITSAISLTNNATETEWGQALLNAAESVCFPDGRVKFWAPGREAVPLQGQMLCYFGEDRKVFRSRFATFGHVR